LLNDFANFVNNYKIKQKIFISFIIKRSKTIITIFKVIISTFFINIIVFVLLSKKCNRLSKIIENALIFKKREKLSKIETTTNNKQDNDVEIFS